MIEKTIYDTINEQSCDVFTSVAQSNELRDVKQVYRQAATVKKNETAKEVSHEFTLLLKAQQEDKEFVRTISRLIQSYYPFLGDDIQLNDIVKFCCDGNGVLPIDTTYNLCNRWVTDSRYQNTRLKGPAIIHFEKSAFVFSRFASEKTTLQPKIKDLNVIGSDQEMAIYQGFSSQITDLKLLLCVYHLEKTDKQKITQLSLKNGTMKKIIADIYGCQYGSVKEFGLADSTYVNDLDGQVEELKPRWDDLCPGFCEWFLKSGRRYSKAM